MDKLKRAPELHDDIKASSCPGAKFLLRQLNESLDKIDELVETNNYLVEEIKRLVSAEENRTTNPFGKVNISE